VTLDEAIAKAKADGDVQLAEWLRQARGADAAGRWYTETLDNANRTIRKLLDENAKLREYITKLEQANIVLDSDNTELRNDMRDMQMFVDENVDLRELAGQVLCFTTMTDGCGDNCPYLSSDCSHKCHLREQGRELGIEVGE